MAATLAPPKMDKKTALLQKAAGDSKLSVEAVGLLTMLCLSETALELATKPPELARYIGVGRDKTRKLLNKLDEHGYIQKRQVRQQTPDGKTVFGENKIKISVD